MSELKLLFYLFKLFVFCIFKLPASQGTLRLLYPLMSLAIHHSSLFQCFSNAPEIPFSLVICRWAEMYLHTHNSLPWKDCCWIPSYRKLLQIKTRFFDSILVACKAEKKKFESRDKNGLCADQRSSKFDCFTDTFQNNKSFCVVYMKGGILSVISINLVVSPPSL